MPECVCAYWNLLQAGGKLDVKIYSALGRKIYIKKKKNIHINKDSMHWESSVTVIENDPLFSVTCYNQLWIKYILFMQVLPINTVKETKHSISKECINLPKEILKMLEIVPWTIACYSVVH